MRKPCLDYCAYPAFTCAALPVRTKMPAHPSFCFCGSSPCIMHLVQSQVQTKGQGWDIGIPAPIICPRQMNIRSGRPRTCRHQLLLAHCDCVHVSLNSATGRNRYIVRGMEAQKRVASTLFNSFLDSIAALACRIRQLQIRGRVACFRKALIPEHSNTGPCYCPELLPDMLVSTSISALVFVAKERWYSRRPRRGRSSVK